MPWRSAHQLLEDDDDGEASAAFGGLLWAAREPKIFHHYRGSPPIKTSQFVVGYELPCDCEICQSGARTRAR